MSNSEGPKGQRRHVEVHAVYGNRHQRVFFPRSTDIDLKATYPTTRQVDNPSVPTAETLPVPESVPFTHRDGVHLSQPYRPTAFPMKVSAPRETQPQADRVVYGMTKVIGKANKNGWKTPKATAKTDRKRQKADKWMAKNGHKIR